MGIAWHVLLRWIAGGLLFSIGATLVGCVAQQADVVRIKRELDAKISQLNKSKTSLQQAVVDANTSLEKANTLITRQRAEIKELLRARAEVTDQVATLKDTDLSQVRGAIEKNQHLVGALDQKFLSLDTKIQTVESEVQESQRVIEPLVQELRAQLTAEEQLRVEQGGKLGEFRTSLVDYQQVLSTLRQNIGKQEQQITTLQQQVNRLGQQQDTHYQQIQREVNDVRQHIQTVIGTVEQISTTFSGRLDAYEQERSRASQQMPSKTSSPSRQSMESLPTRNPYSSIQSVDKSAIHANRSPQNVLSGSAVSYASPSTRKNLTSSFPPGTSSSPSTSRDEHVAYQQAFLLLRTRNYSEAAKGFSEFLRTFPNSPLAANSQYWLGECYYGQRRFQEAIDEFERVFAFYSSSNKVPASLLKIGYSHLELQQPAMARSVFQQLVRTYPQSQAAIKAHGRLQEVNTLLHNPS